MIKKVILFSALGVAFFSLTGCKKEKQTHDIITKIAPKPRIPKTPIALKGFNYTKTVQWLGTQYTITIIRQADKDLPLVNDEDGRKYYDNKISVKIMRKDGKDFYQRYLQRPISANLSIHNMTKRCVGRLYVRPCRPKHLTVRS